MAIEIELKAWVENPQELEKKLSQLGVYKFSFEKDDIFYRSVKPNQNTAGISDYGVRIRNEKTGEPNGISKETCIVTRKTKSIRNSIEVNNEIEFEASSGMIFEEFIKDLGFEKYAGKCKKGKSFDYKGMTAELSLVENLGWFIELEIIAEDEKPTEQHRKKLLDFLDKLGVPSGSIECRNYTEMLTSDMNRG